VECICACTGLLFFLPLVSAPDSRYGRYWANQGLLILFTELVALLIWALTSWILGLLAMIPFIGIVFRFLRIAAAVILFLASLILPIRSIVCVSQKRAVDIPVIGYLRFIK
jgi:uncharacterized membrane protein